MKKKNIAILYVSTGKYKTFWKDFFLSSEKYFFNNSTYQKKYFVFTDAKEIDFEEKDCVYRLYQEQLSWPYITLDRFKIFQKVRIELEKMDYIYFFNANMIFIDYVAEDILPMNKNSLVMVKHPGFFDKTRDEFTYENSIKSLAYISKDEGKNYFMGGLNGGKKEEYLALIDELEKNIDIDRSKEIMALWHDESHLNRYAINNASIVQVLDPSYGYPEGWDIPFKAKIIIRDKNKYGGHNFLRDKKNFFQKIIEKVQNCF